MWSVESNMTKVLLNIQTCNKQYLFTQGMWSEEPSMIMVLKQVIKNINLPKVFDLWNQA